MSATPMTVRDARKKWQGNPDTRAEAVRLIQGGWTLVEKTKHVHATCPHGYPGDGIKPIMLSSTPQNDGRHARRVRRETGHCPDHHERLNALRRPPGT